MNTFNYHRKYTAFTLAEVLITLGIIGVVAAMTIPTLLQNHRDKETVSKVKKTYSILSQAVLSAINENGTPDNWWSPTAAIYDTAGTENMLNYLPIKYIKNCGTTDTTCGPPVQYLYGGGSSSFYFYQDAHFSKAQLADGVIVYAVLSAPASATGLYGKYYVDINGKSEPNRIGYDTFSMDLSKTGIRPPTISSFPTACKNILTDSTTSGGGCTPWVLYKENLDYQRCSDLDWNTKIQCD